MKPPPPYHEGMDLASAFLVGIVVAGIAGAIHVVLRWMGDRGWIFYGEHQPAPLGTRAAMAMMELDSLVNPAVEHVIEYRRHGDLWVEESGEPE